MKSLIVFAAAATPQRNDTLWIVRSGMEARRQMISEEGRAYHRALEKKQMEQKVTYSK